MFLIDTNIWLEIILEQENAEEARDFLQSIDSSSIFITDFSVCSIGIYLLRGKKHDIFTNFINDAFVKVRVGLVRLDPIEMRKIPQINLSYNLDFDDAYQYVVAEKYDLTIVSFDGDFDRTHRGRKTPQDILNELKEREQEK